MSADSVRNSKLLTRFQKDLELYQKATGKATNEVLATQALNFSIKYSNLLKERAPSRSEIRGYNVRVRDSILDKVGGSYKGKFRRSVGGQRITNKRAWAVHRELARRRASVKWLSKSVAKWSKTLNKDIPEKRVGHTKGRFTAKKDTVRVTGEAFGLAENRIGRHHPGLQRKALISTSKDVRQFTAKRIGKEFSKNIRKVYS